MDLQAKQLSNSNMVQQSIMASKKKKFVRAAAGEVWEDPTLAEWPDSECLCGRRVRERTRV